MATIPEEARLIRPARRSTTRSRAIVDRIRQRAAELKHPVIACLGLSYKPNVDDLRDSPAVEIVRRLAEERVGEILVVEPHIAALPPELAAHGLALHDFDRAVERANLVVLLVDHMSFRAHHKAAGAAKRGHISAARAREEQILGCSRGGAAGPWPA